MVALSANGSKNAPMKIKSTPIATSQRERNMWPTMPTKNPSSISVV